MLKEMIFAATYSSGSVIGDALNSWADTGLFDLALPFLLIFAVVYGLLDRMKIFKEKGVNVIIALASGLLSIQFGFVGEFFSALFPRFGIGIAIILVALIAIGMFVTEKKSSGIFMGIGAVVLVMVLANTAGALGWSGANWWYENWPDIVLVVGIIAMIIAVVNTKPDESKSILEKIVQREPS